MASLADELNFDAGFADVYFGGNGHGVQMSFEDELQGRSFANQDHSPPSSPHPSRRGGRRERGGGRRMRDGYDSADGDAHHSAHSALVSNGEPFSLADELGGGNAKHAEFHSGKQNHPPASTTGEQNSDIETTLLDQDMRARRDQEHYLTSSEILNESFRSTQKFLRDLYHAYSGITAGASTSHTLPSTSSYSSLNGSRGTVEDGLSTVEGRASSLLKQMRVHMSTREEQIRELQECDRLLKRAFEEGGDWITALADVDELSNGPSDGVLEDDHDRDLSFISTTSQHCKGRSLRDASTGEGEMDPVIATSLDDSVHSLPQGQPQEARSATTLCQQLASLQHSTVDLVVSLGSIHEQSQVAQASMNDAARRIRSMKTVLNTWTTDVKSAEDSQAHITAWESESNQRPRDMQAWTKVQMDKFQWILNDADVKARELLSPIQDPVLDRLATTG